MRRDMKGKRTSADVKFKFRLLSFGRKVYVCRLELRVISLGVFISMFIIGRRRPYCKMLIRLYSELSVA